MTGDEVRVCVCVDLIIDYCFHYDIGLTLRSKFLVHISVSGNTSGTATAATKRKILIMTTPTIRFPAVHGTSVNCHMWSVFSQLVGT